VRRDDGSDEPFVVGAASVVGSSAKALRVKLEASSVLGAKEFWIPKSVVHDDSEVYDALNNARGELIVQRWFAIKEGWVTE
jgi:hypothetical protein